MKNLLNPKWIFIANIIPCTLLALLAYGQYNIIESLLSSQSKQIWLIFGSGLLILSFCSIAYAVWCLIKKIDISIIYSILTLILYTTFLYCYVQNSSKIIPFSIPQWMVSSEVMYYPGTFLMPTLIYSLLTLIVCSVPKHKKINPWLNFLYGLMFPLIGYLFFQITLPLWQIPESSYAMHVTIVLFIAATILFLFFICRGIYILTTSYSSSITKYALAWKIIIAIVFPILGLAVNNGLFSDKSSLTETSPFGNFSDPLFYLIALINGILLCLPEFKHEHHRLIRFFALIICFPYTLYFFLLFLPFLPLSIIAIIAVGIGFLMLAPLLLFIVQLNELYTEWLFFSKKYSIKMLAITFIFCLSIIPSIITLFYLYDKSTLNNALNYVYNNNFRQESNISLNTLSHTLNTIKNNKGRNQSTPSNKYLPFLSSYYNWLVLDNMILSDTKIAMMEQLFFGEKNIQNSAPIAEPVSTAKISSFKTKSTYNRQQQTWISTLDLTLKNTDIERTGNYATEFTLPDGCWISDYYLYIGKRKEVGILAEKKSALWVFKQIRNENRDPGILHYLTGNRIAFQVFPFAKNELRQSGIQFTHKEPVTFNIDGHKISLGNDSLQVKTDIQYSENAIYIPASEKLKLPLIQRNPEYHFIIDVSKDNFHLKKSYINRIDKYLTNHKIDTKAVKINLTNIYTTKIGQVSDLKMKLEPEIFKGGFNLDGAIRQILLNSYRSESKSYPIVIVVTDSIQHAVMHKDFADLSSTFPEQSNFYELAQHDKIWEHSLINQPLKRLQQVTVIVDTAKVYAWPNSNHAIAYLTNNNLPSIIANPSHEKDYPLDQKSWRAGLNIQGMWLESNINPKHGEKTHLALIQQSMSHHILSPLTSFIVVENEAQKKALKKKQDQILSGNKNLDPDEDTQSMDEPNLFLLLALIGVFIGFSLKNKSGQIKI